jgi:uncharacterized protein (TIGR00106 family)
MKKLAYASSVDNRARSPYASNDSIVYAMSRSLSCPQDHATDVTVSSPAMVLLEMSITPLGKGESVSQYVAECVALVDQSGLEYELHSMGTIVEGELDAVLDLMRRCIELVAQHSDRVTCAAKLDYRRGQSGRLKSKVTSVEQKLGREVRKG